MAQQCNVLKSVGRAFGIIEYMAEAGSSTVTQIAIDLDMPKSTVQMHLNTLYEERMIVKRDGKYELGVGFLQYGMAVLRRHQLFPVVKGKVENLAEQTGELAACFVEDRGEAVYLYGKEGEQSIRTDLDIGDRTDLHAVASGKAIIAFLPDDQINEIIQKRGLDRKTKNTITDPEELLDELEQIRERGYACSLEESIEGMRVVAAPLLWDDQVLGSISLAGPANRFVGDYFHQEIPSLVTGTANEIEMKLQYSDTGL